MYVCMSGSGFFSIPTVGAYPQPHLSFPCYPPSPCDLTSYYAPNIFREYSKTYFLSSGTGASIVPNVGWLVGRSVENFLHLKKSKFFDYF